MEIKMFLGVLFIFLLSELNHIHADDREQFRSMMFGKHDERIRTNISKRSPQPERGGNFYSLRKPRAIRRSCKSCGRSYNSFEEEVLGGDNVNPYFKYPWMVNLKYASDDETFCSGSIISAKFVLTAAHCLVKRGQHPEIYKKQALEFVYPKDIKVAFTTDTSDVRPGPAVMEVIPHPGFSFLHMSHDIALLKLSRRITCNRYQSPICLPPAGYKLPEGTWLTIAGWGATVLDGPSSQELKEAKVKHVNYRYCSAENFTTYSKGDYYCLQNFKKQSIHSGDSGGPMFNKGSLFKDGLFYILGVASQETYFKGNEPFIFSSVPKHMRWITEVTSLSSHTDIESSGQDQTRSSHDDYETGPFGEQSLSLQKENSNQERHQSETTEEEDTSSMSETIDTYWNYFP